MYYVYMLRCKDDSLYTGITVDIKRRMGEHFKQNEKCAKYTMTHQAKRLEALWRTENKSLASKLEYAIKLLTKKQKEDLILDKDLSKHVRSSKVEVEKYEVEEISILNYIS